MVLDDNFIDDAVGFALFGGHDEITLDIFFDFFDRLPGMMREHCIERACACG